MAYAKSYGSGAANSSSGDKEKTRKVETSSSPYRSPYERDMYDDMTPVNKNARGPVNGGIQGNASKGSEGKTQDKSQEVMPKYSGQDSYGKGNPYHSPAPGKGSKPDTSAKPVSQKKQDAQPGKTKRTFKSLAELKDMAKDM